MSLKLTTAEGAKIEFYRSYISAIDHILKLEIPRGPEPSIHLELKFSESEIEDLIYMLRG